MKRRVPSYARRTIAPLDQAGSWQLEDYLVIVEKGALKGELNKMLTYRVQIVRMDPWGVAFEDTTLADSPCGAAVEALLGYFGESSKEVKEFTDHYPCSDPPGQNQRKMKLSLDGLPKWARPPRG